MIARGVNQQLLGPSCDCKLAFSKTLESSSKELKGAALGHRLHPRREAYRSHALEATRSHALVNRAVCCTC